jgi:hypothetical protein
MNDQQVFVCDVPSCLALVVRGSRTCPLHRLARLANELHVARVSGTGGQRCLACRRYFQPTDYVETTSRPKPVRKGKPAMTHGYQHVSCEPPTTRVSKRKIRESPKPLLEIA